MRMFSKIKYLLPYGLVRFIQRRRADTAEYAGDYETWQEAQRYALGYDAPNIVAKVKASTQEVIDGKALFERDSVLFYQDDYNWPLLSAFGYLAAKLRGHLHVLDFGGALGSTYWQNRKILREIAPDLSWHVVEQQGFLDAAKTLHYDEPLFFHKSIEEAKKFSAINVVLFSSVLQYIDDWESIINSIADVNFILIDRSPEFTEKMESQIMVQKVPASIYTATYPARIFGKNHWRNSLQGIYDPILSWNSADGTACTKDNGKRMNPMQYVGGLFCKIVKSHDSEQQYEEK